MQVAYLAIIIANFSCVYTDNRSALSASGVL